MDQLKKLKGQNHEYFEIGKRGHERIAVSIAYSPHPQTGVGYLLIRFIAYAEPGTFPQLKMKHFFCRDIGTVHDENDDPLKMVRLNREAVQLFSSGVSINDVVKIGDDFQVWGIIGGWVKDQLDAEGFEAIATDFDFEKFVRGLFPAPGAKDNVKLLLELPDLAVKKSEAQKAGSSKIQKLNDFDAN